MLRSSDKMLQSVIILLSAVAVLPISPKLAHTSPDTELRVTCNHESTTLDKCQFHVWLDHDYDDSPRADILDFSRGIASQKQMSRNKDHEVNFKV